MWRTLLTVGMLAMLGATASALAEEQKEAEPIQAVWKPQEITFYYQSFTTYYSCESLESKLEQILRQVGAQAEVRVRSVDCGRGPARLPRAEIRLIAPVEATPEALAELKKGQSVRELVARVSGRRDVVANLEKPFLARWERVTVGRGRGGLEAGDCELLEQVRRQILPKLAVRVIEDNTPCPPNSPGLTRPSLVVEALIKVPEPDEVAPKSGAREK